jgi:hypothetical protein
MSQTKWYSPQLARETVRRLYFRAKAEGIPMTVLANQLMEEALGNNRPIVTVETVEHQELTTPQ